jgi:predicted TIM-barrel fold metal-dependent hydrolase
MKFLKLGTVLFAAAALSCGQAKPSRQPVIDVHLHSVSLANLKDWGPNPVTGKKAPESVEEHIKQTLMGEVCAQYDGLSPSDEALDPYFALAESQDVPACVHMGMSVPGITESAPKFRVSLGNPLLLEEMLNRHPKLRVWIAHMGFPFLQETYGILGVYPQVYADLSASWLGTRDSFYANLRQEIVQGCGQQIMFGSDQMTWPDAIGIAIDWIEEANFLTAEQKRDILYNNAARFLRLPPELIARHHGVSKK